MNTENICSNEKVFSQNIKKRFIIAMRHGERTDLAGFIPNINKYDPELTENGKNQAYDAGQRLKEILDSKFMEEKTNLKNKKIAIVSSPFTRTLETAKYFKHGCELNVPIFIENGLSEFISKNWFKNSPDEFLCYYNLINRNESLKEFSEKSSKRKDTEILNKEYFLNEFMYDVLINQSIMRLPEYPESTNKCIARFHNTLDSLILNYFLRMDFDILILVTHVFGIQALCEKMEMPVDYYDIEYCSTFIFNYNEEAGIFKFLNFYHPA